MDLFLRRLAPFFIVVLLLPFLLFAEGESSRNSCKWAIKGMHYTLPDSYTKNYEIVEQMFKWKSSGDAANLYSLFYKFLENPHWKAKKSNVQVPLKALVDHFGQEFSAITSSLLENIMTTISRAKATYPVYFVSWETFGIRAINQLSSHRIHLVGLVNEEKFVHDDVLIPMLYAVHDIFHSVSYEKKINFNLSYNQPQPKTLLRDFYRKIKYEEIFKGLQDREQLLFDISYFLFFREEFGLNNWEENILKAYPLKDPSRQLKGIYQKSFSEWAMIKFDEKDKLSLNMNLEEKFLGSIMAERFLDKKDLWILLPIEVREKVNKTEGAHEKLQVVGEFLSEAMELFFNIHYAHANSFFREISI